MFIAMKRQGKEVRKFLVFLYFFHFIFIFVAIS